MNVPGGEINQRGYNQKRERLRLPLTVEEKRQRRDREGAESGSWAEAEQPGARHTVLRLRGIR